MYIDIKIGNERYTQRTEFSKITIENDNGLKYFISDLGELPEFQRNLINILLKVKENPDKYFEYRKEDEKMVITKYIGNTKHVIIPEEIDGYKVCSIDKIFDKEDKVETIIIPDTITTLPLRFCQELSNLKFVQLSENIEEIPTETFSKCKNLKYINLKNIKEIGAYGFFDCNNLENINLENAETIRPFGFLCCIGLKSINLPKAKAIHPHAFSFCEGLKSVTLNDKINVIKEATFSNCKNLENINLPSSLLKIERSAFYGCSALKKIIFPEKLKKIDDEAFSDSGLSGIINLPPSLTTIGSQAFFNGQLKQVNLSKKTKYKSNSFYFPYVNIVKYDEIKRKPITFEEER